MDVEDGEIPQNVTKKAAVEAAASMIETPATTLLWAEQGEEWELSATYATDPPTVQKKL